MAEIVDGRVSRLDDNTATKIRKGQIITKIADIVRELVDNSVDSGATSIQVLLENFGIDKIEIRDTGCGMSPSDFKLAIIGGHTSKLKNDEHLSSNKHYGFRGEALSSVCSIANVTFNTKTKDEAQGRRYVVNQQGEVISESPAVMGNGTTTTVKDVFFNYPVRKKWVSDKVRKAAELKDIDNFLKSMAIANPKIHLSVYHDGNLLWTKPSVTTTNQALVTVLGVITARKLEKCGPMDIFEEVDNNGNTSCFDGKGKIEIFLPKKPIDYKTLSYTSNKMSMIFVNRRRVYIRDLEKLIQKYGASVSEKPVPSDHHRFPVSILTLEVPPNEVDFNLNTDKAKVFLIHKDKVAERLEEILIQFYEVDLKNRSNEAEDPTTNKSKNGEKQQPTISNDPSCRIDIEKRKPSEQNHVNESSSSLLSKRSENVSAFLENIPTASCTNFTHNSPVKWQQKQITASNLSNIPSSASSTTDNNRSLELPSSHSTPLLKHLSNSVENVSSTKSADGKVGTVSNFDLDFNLDFLDDTQSPPSKKSRMDEIDQNEWIHGSLTDKFGEVIESVAVVRAPSTVETNLQFKSKPIINCNSFVRGTFTGANSQACATKPRNSFPSTKAHTTQPFSSSFCSRSAIATPSRRGGRQVTLDSFENWKSTGKQVSNVLTTSISAPSKTLNRYTPKMASSVNSNSETTQAPKDLDISPLGTAPKSVKDYLNSRRMYTSDVADLQQTISSQQFFPATQSPSDNLRSTISEPKIVGLLPNTSLYAAKINNTLGVFSPLNFVESFPAIKEKFSIGVDSRNDSIDDHVLSLLTEFSLIQSSPLNAHSNIFCKLKDLDVLEFEPGVASTQYSM